MKIDNDNDSRDNQSTIRRIQDYQEQQLLQQQEDQRRAAEDRDRAAQGTQDVQDPGVADGGAELQDPSRDVNDVQDINAQDVQAQLQARTVAQVNESRELTGAEKTDEATVAASDFQDRGERWEAFAARDTDTQLPPSVEELAQQQNQADAQADAQAETQRKINVQDLLNQMTIQRGRING